MINRIQSAQIPLAPPAVDIVLGGVERIVLHAHMVGERAAAAGEMRGSQPRRRGG